MKFFSCIIILFSSFSSSAAVLKGIVKSLEGEPLPFANVFIKTTGTGTTTNADGFYTIEIPNGVHEIIFKYIGYKTAIEKIIVDEVDVELNIFLEKESIWLHEVIVKPGVEDLAYQIIRNAIANKKLNKHEADEYECEAYIKGLQRLEKYPKRILGVKVNLGEYVDPKTGIVYLSESISRLRFKYPDKINEEIISSKVSGNNRAFSFNRASDFIFTIYDNLIDIGISQRMFISPISNNTFFYYKFRLEGIINENEQVIYKIRLLPVRQHDPVFRGFIYITEDRWRVQSLDLIVTKEAIIEFVDTLRIKQEIMPVKENLWMPVSLHLSFNFKAFGFEGNGYYLANYRNYKFNNNFSKKTFKGEVIVIKKESNKREETYWEQVRPIPLTMEEKNDYVRKDSIFLIKETDSYKDSIDAVNNKFSFSKLILTGLTISKRKFRTEYNFQPLIKTAGFNTVQGWNGGISVGYNKRLDDYKRIFITPYLNYGFSDRKLNSTINLLYSYDRQNFAIAGLRGGRTLSQFSDENPVDVFSNTFSSLFYERNYLKLYDKKFINLNHQYEILNGLKTNFSLEIASRSAVENTSDYKIKDFKERVYTTNLPITFNNLVFPAEDSIISYRFTNHEAFILQLKLSFVPGAKYYSRPSGKYLIKNKYPEFHLNIINALPFSKLMADYLFFEGGFTQGINFKNAGSTQIYFNSGKFITKNNLIFPDWKHFYGNRMFLSGRNLQQFQLMGYYSHSTINSFAELHAEHQFAGYFFNKIPGLRKLKLTEVAGVHVLSSRAHKPYLELTFGLEKLSIKLEYAFSPLKNYKAGAFRLSLPF